MRSYKKKSSKVTQQLENLERIEFILKEIKTLEFKDTIADKEDATKSLVRSYWFTYKEDTFRIDISDLQDIYNQYSIPESDNERLDDYVRRNLLLPSIKSELERRERVAIAMEFTEAVREQKKQGVKRINRKSLMEAINKKYDNK